jgi:calcineurin-like phosphoesterase family protein
MSENFFCSDHHLHHANIILHANRPYAQAGVHYDIVDGKKQWKNETVKRECGEAMTEDLIRKHNSIVQPQDIVWYLGDFCFGQATTVFNSLRRMNGKFKFVKGNHDRPLIDALKLIKNYPDLDQRVEFLGDYAEVTIDSQLIILCHYAFRTWRNSHRKSYSLFGHSHGTLPDLPDSLSIDVGVDCHNYLPLRFDQVREIMNRKKFVAIDHHGSKD